MRTKVPAFHRVNHRIDYLRVSDGTSVQLTVGWTGTEYVSVVRSQSMQEVLPDVFRCHSLGQAGIVALRPSGRFRTADLRQLADAQLALFEQGINPQHP